MTRARADGQATAPGSAPTRALATRALAIARVARRGRVRGGARASVVAATFALSMFAGFGVEPTAVRPTEIAPGFEPRPYAMTYAVRQAVAERRRAIAEAARVATAQTPRSARTAAMRASAFAPAETSTSPVDRFDAVLGATVAFAPRPSAAPGPSVPLPLMRPVGTAAPRP